MENKISKLKLSKRTEWVSQSEIRAMSIECARQGGINLSQGIADTEVPPVVRQGVTTAIEKGINSYTRYDGRWELREALSGKIEKFTGLQYDPESEIIVSGGATGALYCAAMSLLEPGDEVILFEPYYGYHISTLLTVGAVPVYVKLNPPSWDFDEAELESVITSRTRAILINTPANPSGKVFSKEEIEGIGKIAEEHDLFIFTDEIYEHFIYGKNEHVAPAAIPGLRERTITISGFSKTFSITGWRIGYCACDKKWAKAIGHFNDLIYVCAPAPLQIGVADGLKSLGEEYYKNLADEYLVKRDKICNALAATGMQPYVPEGSYYVLADISRIPGRDSKERSMRLLAETGVATVPGMAFYHDDSGETLARFCFAKENSVLDEACQRIERLKI